MFLLISAIVRRTLSEIWIAFEPGAAKMPIATAGLLSSSERSAYSDAPSSTRAMSRSRDRAVALGLDDDVAELRFALQPPLGVDRELQVGLVGGFVRLGRGADDPYGRLHVLPADRLHHVVRRQVVLGGLARIEPHPHRVVAAA